MEQGAAHVEVLAIRAVQHSEGSDVDGKAGHRDPGHQHRLDGARFVEPDDGLEDDPRGDGEQGEAVDEGGEHREAPEAECAA